MKRTWLIQKRLKKGMSQAEVAKAVGKTTTCYFYIENNMRNPTVKLAQKIADVLEFDWTLFFPTKIGKNPK